mmetsp:Transcript_38060/g.72955  ORF Transcript_38060/g.72955 Transcript_38060/m.72955 type:complete len:601 (+) Transcript_38060:121-1923(+)|eukprot:CAMPEP_0114248342 /NCGR_PEP_ID=MMETSP0058-20121206/13521_1 /TAXON_ID=36894 /ORGANISM="Pyramimonas parkeae, CCMP726" /LENGTH=600 /DNA_ID=CAMNT_0001361741 /DNA_START=63 /DNA_END=1865 /DNA_ORIENTATION=+
MKRPRSGYLESFLSPAALARRPQRLLPWITIACVGFFFIVERQRRFLEGTDGAENPDKLDINQVPVKTEMEALAKRHAELAKETTHLAEEAERLAESLKHPSLLASSQPPAPPLATTLQDGMLNIEAMSIDFDGWVKAGPDVAKRDAVKAAMAHAWKGYSTYSFGMDELQPIAKRGKNLFAGLGATIIDSLDTLYIMGMMDEYNKAREWVATSLTFDKQFEASVFETVIRIVGGFLSAYDLSGDRMYVDKCKELVERLQPAYRTPTGIPYNVVNLKTGQAKNPAWTQQASTLAEFGTQQLEFVGLSHATGDSKYAQQAEYVIKYATDPTAHRNRQVPAGGEGLYPLFLNPISGMWTSPKISFGAMGDSFFEYLIKMWVQGGRTPALDRYRELFDKSMDGMINVLVQQSSPSGLVYVAEWDRAGLVHKMDHLACFVPGMLALGANGENAKRYLTIAQQLMYTCVQMYFRQPSGLAPEFVWFRKGEDMVSGAHHNLLRPETVESLMILYRKTGDPIYRQWGWRIFQAFETHCKVPDGYVGLRDVRSPTPQKDDTMQSFFLAETLKYLYLLFDDTSHIAMDEWVFNTEAHPTKVFRRDTSFIN